MTSNSVSGQATFMASNSLTVYANSCRLSCSGTAVVLGWTAWNAACRQQKLICIAGSHVGRGLYAPV